MRTDEIEPSPLQEEFCSGQVANIPRQTMELRLMS
jgi:hypothetical protein